MRALGVNIVAATMVLGVGGGGQAAEAPLYGPAPSWVTPLKALLPEGGASPTALEVRLWDNQVRFSGDGRDAYSEVAYRINSSEALTLAGSVAGAWDPQTQMLTVHHIRVLRGSQVIDALAGGRKLTVLHRERNLESAMLDGVLTATLQLEGLQVGDIVDVAVTMHDSQPALHGQAEAVVSLAHAGVTAHMHLAESWPDALPMRWRVSDDLAAPTLVHAGGWTTLGYDLKAASTPPPPNGAPIRYAIRGLVETTSFKDWAQVSALMAPAYVKAAQLSPASPLKAEAARIRAAHAGAGGQALAVLQLVQDQVRYLFVGLNNGAYTPAAADTTWSRRFGDCKAKTALLLALLHELGIEAEPALVSTVAGDGLDQRLPTLSVFDHVVVRAVVDGRVFWLDGTRKGDRSLEDAGSLNLHWTLPLRASGARLEPWPTLDPKDPLDEKRITFDMSDGFDAAVRVRGEHIYRGDAAVLAQAGLKAQSVEEQARALRQAWSSDYAWLKPDKVDWSYEADQRTLRMTLEGTGTANWFDDGGKRQWWVDDTSLGWDASFRRDPGVHAADAPYAVAYPAFQAAQVTVLLPDGGRGVNVANTPEVDETVAGVAYRRTAHLAGDRLEITTSSHAVAQEFPAAEADAAGSELQRLSRSSVLIAYPLASRRIAERTTQPAETPPATAEDFAYRGEDHMGERSYAAAIADFTQAIRLAPTTAKYLYDRGAAHYGAHEDDLALADFKTALRLDPRDSFALFAQGKLRLERGDIAGARTDLEAALANTSDRPRDLLREADTYEKARDYVDAVQAFDRWLAEDPKARDRARILNLRCWTRAEWGRELPGALADCDAALQAEPQNASFLDSRALVQLRLGRLEQAIADSTAALRLQPGLATSLYTRGLAKQRQGDRAGGAADLAAAVAAAPRTTVDFAAMGLPAPSLTTSR